MSDQPQDQWREKANQIERDWGPSQFLAEHIAQALADAFEAGRESVAKWHDESAMMCMDNATRTIGHPADHAYWKRGHGHHVTSAAAIRAGRMKP